MHLFAHLVLLQNWRKNICKEWQVNVKEVGRKGTKQILYFGSWGKVANNGSALYVRPTRAFKFKLTPAFLALRVCKPEGGRRVVTCLSAKEISWPKDFSGGLEITNLTVGLDEAQPVVQVPSLKKGSLVKPSAFQVNSDAQSMWALGESLRGILCGASESPVSTVVPVLNVDSARGVSVVSPSIRLEGANLDIVGCALMWIEIRIKRGLTVELGAEAMIFDALEKVEKELKKPLMGNDKKGMAVLMAEFNKINKKLGIRKEDLPKYEEQLELKIAKAQPEELKKDTLEAMETQKKWEEFKDEEMVNPKSLDIRNFI
nr:putative atp synthase 24 kda subunit, mitochondrial [Quercus suber]